jgi:GxxExxY protein
MNRTREGIEQIAAQVVDAMLNVHRAFGPGLLEKTYQVCVTYELERPSDQGRDQAHGQRVMSGFIDLLCALGIFAV